MKIAVIGSGISGLACAHYLSPEHEVWLYEGDSRLGGHTATKDVKLGTRTYAVDTGFIVFNDWTYPNFIALMDELGVRNQPTSMGFSVRDPETGLEYSGASIDTLFAQRRNFFSPSFLGMVRDILRFNKEAIADIEAGTLDDAETLGQYLARNRYGDYFIHNYLVPMGSAIWSSDCTRITEFPVSFFLRFFRNHGLLSVKDRPQWRTILGGSRQYIQPLTQRFAERISLGNPVASVQRRLVRGVTLVLADGQRAHFDQVVFATHSDTALSLLEAPTDAEREILGAIPYQSNDVVLHTDTRMLPRNTRTWSSWNYTLAEVDKPAIVTYNMNILQNLQAPETFCVTLNDTASINPHRILGRFSYDHPVFSLDGMAAQQRWDEINGVADTWYCGAYWHNGFHEDGVVSALRVAEAMGQSVRIAA